MNRKAVVFMLLMCFIVILAVADYDYMGSGQSVIFGTSYEEYFYSTERDCNDYKY